MLEKVLKEFGIEGTPELFGDGHINTTYRVGEEYIVQKINKDIFTNVDGVMDNIFLVTGHIKQKLIENGEDFTRQTIEYLHTKSGGNYAVDDNGDPYRAYHYIGKAYTVSDKKTPEMLYQAAKAIGKFQNLLSDFDAEKLFTVIPDFHNTPKRFASLKKSVSEDPKNRVKEVKPELDFAYSLENMTGLITDAIEDGSVPLRVSHNDTKLNNILFDNDTNEGLCLIDLDTVMSGSYLYDFGDAMRFGASSAPEDCTELDKVYFDLELFEAFTKGYLESASDVLTQREKELVYSSVIIMTYECGIRFLKDYIDGDVYFRIAYEKHNLDRARNQFKLVKDMLEKKEIGEAIVKKYL